MKRAIFSTAIFFIICFLFQGMALATGGSWGNSHSNTPRVHNLADILKSGEIVGKVNFCGAQGTNGAHVDLVGESFTAVLGASGDFKLRYVPRGAYTLRVSIPGQPEHTQPVTVKRRQVTDIGGISLCPDNDGDGFTLAEDCNDNNASINPDAEELCDGVDNDCDGAVDGPGCECTDADNDGFFAQEGCGTAVDCNDDNDTINPSATEICDGVDNNCDGTDDEGFDLNTDLNNCGVCTSVCSGSCQGGVCFAICGNNVVEEGEQCDDGNTEFGDECNGDCTLPAACSDGTPSGESRPCDGPDSDQCMNGLQTCENGVFSACEETITDIVEICNGIDDDCDGVSDEGTAAGECNDGNICTTDVCNSSSGCTNSPLPVGTPCGSGLACDGNGVCQTTDSDGDGFPSDVDCNDNDPSINPGAVDTCNGIDDNCNNTTDENTTTECSPYACGGSSGCFTTCGTAGSGSDTFCAPGFHCESSDQDVLSCVPDTAVCGNGVVEAGEQCDDGNLINGDGCQNDCMATISGTGTYNIQPAAIYSCAFGFFDLNVQSFSFQGLGGASIQVIGAPSGPTMTGTVDSTGFFQVGFVIPGDTTENFVLTGQFSDPDNWTGTFSVGFTGNTLDCVNQNFSVAGSR